MSEDPKSFLKQQAPRKFVIAARPDARGPAVYLRIQYNDNVIWQTTPTFATHFTNKVEAMSHLGRLEANEPGLNLEVTELPVTEAEDPKDTFRRIRAKQKADTEAEHERQVNRRIARQRERRQRQPPPEGNENEAAQWVRENLEWEEYPSLWVPKFCSWSDYSGSLAEQSNGKALMRDHPDLFEEGFGGHGTVWVGISEEKRLNLTEEQFDALKDIVRTLADYPVLDDQMYSELQMESQWEYWQEYGRDGIREALVKKFEGDADAQIAVLTRPNEFWDTIFQEHSFYDHMSEEEGGNWYFNEEGAARNIEKDEIMDADAVEAAKRKAFFSTGGEHSDARQLETALQAAGVEVDNGEHLWQLLKYAEHELTPAGTWEVKERIHAGKDEVDVGDYIDLLSVRDVVDVLSAPDARQKRLNRQWAQDPRQLKLPGYESRAAKLVAAILDGEDPKAVLRAAKNPNGIPRRYVGNMPKEIEIWGRRWFSRTYGNTYFTARIYVDGQLVHTMPEEYGYGNHYLDRSFEWLEENGYVPMRPRGAGNVPEPPWRWCEQHGIRLNYHAEDIRLRRMRFTEAENPKTVLRHLGRQRTQRAERLRRGERVIIHHGVPDVVEMGQTGVVMDLPEPGWAIVELDDPRYAENNYPFKLAELEPI